MSSLDPNTPLKICIRGLPINTDPRAIAKDLRERGFTPIDVHRVEPRLNQPGCIFFAKLENTPGTVPAVYQIKKLLEHAGISIEAWRGKKGPTQCSQCQGFWHLAANCHREHRCVRCAGPHPLKLCIRPRDKPICANCGGKHYADNDTCPVYRREQRNMKPLPLRIIGYEITTPNVVEEPSAPNSLMAEANEKFVERKRVKKRGGRNKGKNGNSDTSSMFSESQLEFLQPVQDELVSDPAITAPVIEKKVEATDFTVNTDADHDKINSSRLSEQKLQKLKPKQAITIPIEEQIVVPNSNINKKAVCAKVSDSQQQATAVPTKAKNNCNINKEAVPVKASVSETQQPDQKQQEPTKAVPVHTKEENNPAAVMTSSPDRTKVINDCLSILQGVLSAIQVGQSPIPIILQGIVDLKVHLQLSNQYLSGYS